MRQAAALLTAALAIMLGSSGAAAEPVVSKPTTVTFEALQQQWAQDQAKQPIRDWVASRDLKSLTVEELRWSATALATTPALKNQGLSVRWLGSIRPPHDGDYTFTGAALNIDLTTQERSYRSTMRVWIDEQLALWPTADGPRKPANRPLCSAGKFHSHRLRPQPCRREDHFHEPAGSHILLARRGHGAPVNPNSALAPPEGEGDGHGLLGEYTALQANQPSLTMRRVDPQIDFAWTTGNAFLLENPGELTPLVEELVARRTSPEYLDELRQQLQDRPFDFDAWIPVAELMTSAQRAAVLRAWGADKPLLRLSWMQLMKEIYLLFRPGAEPQGVDFVGRWCQANHDLAPLQIRFQLNRYHFRHLGESFTFEYPAGAGLLEASYLVLPDGQCALPAAYILAYCHAFRGELEDWIAFLDARLANDTLTGDTRVGWLIARAQAEEIRDATHKRQTQFAERYDQGLGWLDEASLSAHSEEAKLRVWREKLARAAAADQQDRIAQLWQQAVAQFTSPESQVVLELWQERLAKVTDLFKAERKQQQTAAQSGYVAQLQRRLERAREAKDAAAIARYEKLIEQASAGKPPD